MNHCIDARRGGDMGWQPKAQFGVEHDTIGEKSPADNPCLSSLAGGNNRHHGRLRSSTSSGGHLNQWQARTAHTIDTVHVCQRLITHQQRCCQFSDIHRAAAAKADHAITTRSTGRRHGC